MGKKRVIFYIDPEVHNNFKKICDERGIIMSRKVQMLIEEHIKNVRSSIVGI